MCGSVVEPALSDCWKFAEVVGWCTAPLGECCRNSASQCQSFGFACATTASPGRSVPPWGQLEGWRSRRGKSMSGSVIFLNVQPGAVSWFRLGQS